MEETTTEVLLNEGGNLVRALLLACLVLLAFLALGMVLFKWVLPFMRKRLENGKTGHPVGLILLKSFEKPLSVYLKVAGLLCILLVLALALPSDNTPRGVARVLAALPAFLYSALRVAAIVAVAWGFFASSDVMNLLLGRAGGQLDVKLGKSVTQFLGAVFKIVVVAVAAVVLLSEFNYDINGLVAGLGLGGLTLALAAQDSARNFFGGLVIVLEKPFEIGDYITCAAVEGSVEEINLRSTKVRTAEGSLTTVPNATLSGSNITNWNRMARRRCQLTLTLPRTTTPAVLAALEEDIRAALEADTDVEKQSGTVRFTAVSPTGLELLVLFYSLKPRYEDFLAVQERMNYSLLQLAERHGVFTA